VRDLSQHQGQVVVLVGHRVNLMPNLSKPKHQQHCQQVRAIHSHCQWKR
jgi:hypothetical protein